MLASTLRAMTFSVIAPRYISGMGFSDWARSEDFLTGEFFGLLRYLPVQTGVLQVLARARTKDGLTFPQWLTGDAAVACHQIRLWPEFAQGIPDVLVQLSDGSDKPVADVLIEVKLYSGQSEHRDDPRHQLIRYIEAFATEDSLERSAPRALVYLTLERTIPRDELETALNAAGNARERVTLFWVGWHDVAACLHDMEHSDQFKFLRSHEAAAAQDLRGILRARGIRVDADVEHFPLHVEALSDLGQWPDLWLLALRKDP